jgi:antitoxin (DNA-binding transcriptional repressor) of toxin-antitoxin stability system
MKTVGIAHLKAHLSECLRTVRGGRALTVLDRNVPVAQLTPVETGALEVRKASRRPSDLPPVPKARRATNSLAALLDDRRRR